MTMPQPHDLTGTHVHNVPIALHAAATATETRLLWVAPFKCKIVSIGAYFDVAATGDNTNTTNINTLNGGTAGTGTTEIGNKDYVLATDVVVGTEQVLYAPATPLAVAAGTHIRIQFEKVATGLALSAGIVQVRFQGN
jgi:hypothetical protein